MDTDDQPGASSPLKRASSPASPAHDRPVKKQAPRTRSRPGRGASAKQQQPQSQLLARHRPRQQQQRHPQGSARGASEQHPRNQLVGAWRRGAPQGGRDVHEGRHGAAASPTPTSVDLGSRLREAREAAVDSGVSPMQRSVSFGPVSGRSAPPELSGRANTAPRASRAKPLVERRSAGRPAGKGELHLTSNLGRHTTPTRARLAGQVHAVDVDELATCRTSWRLRIRQAATLLGLLRVLSPAHAAIGRRKFQRAVALLYVLRHRHWSWEILQRAAQTGQVR